jgi:putative sugar O-methyltransferase
MIFKKLFYKSYNLYSIFFTRKKYTENEYKYLMEFNRELKEIKSSNNISEFWSNSLLEIKHFINNNNMLNILQSPTIKFTMIAEPNKLELRKLLTSNKSIYFKDIINEDWVGNPTPYFYYPKSSGNTIHHAYSLLQLYNLYNIDISKLTTIFEFGGGYGNFCKLLIKSNYTGNYIIFDLPFMSSIQKLFLNLSKINFNISFINIRQTRSISLINDISQITFNNPDLFIALWSLSECPIALRDQILENNSDSKYFLIAYSNEFLGTDNHNYFENFRIKMTTHKWISYEIQHMKGHSYLIGKKIGI